MIKMWLIRSVKALNVLMNAALFVVFWEVFYAVLFQTNVPGFHLSTMLIYTALLTLLYRVYNAFDVGYLRISELTYATVLSVIVGDVLMYIYTAMLLQRIPPVLPLIGLLAAQGVWNTLWSYAVNRLYFLINKPKRTVIVYRNRKDLDKLDLLSRYKSRFDIQKYIADPDDIHKLLEEIEGFEVIFVVGVEATLRNGIAKYCVENNIHGYIEPKVGDIIMAGAKEVKSFSLPIMHVYGASPKPEYLLAKRLLDIVISLTALLLLWPVMLIVAILVKAYDRGPVLYKQVRLTQGGREFRILKFRSMRVDAEKDGVARLSTGDKDDRVTPIGRVIRACRLDELPQLINILRGDMTIVGPRPERPEIAADYEKELPAFRLRLQVKAGLTGYAQVYGRYNTQPYDKLQMDLMYINRMSLVEDLRLMLATVKILFLKESTEGVEPIIVNDSDVSA